MANSSILPTGGICLPVGYFFATIQYMKRIGIDARFWGEAGPGRYTSNLVKELEKLDNENKYFIFLTDRGYSDYKPHNKNFTKVKANYRWYSLAEQLTYPELLYKYNLDLLHFAQFNMPLLYLKPFTVTIHDMILHDYPIKKGGFKNSLFYPVKRLGYLINFWWAAKMSKAIVVPSEDAKNDLLKRLGINPSKVTVTLEGFDFELKAKGQKLTAKLLNEKYGVNKPYLLFVGSMYPHKNLHRLVEAFSLFVETGHALSLQEMKLVLLGKESAFSEKLRKQVIKLGLENRVLFPGQKDPNGYVPDEHLPYFYANAEAFVFPSLKEGFGIPPLEAMAFNIPVIASKESCIPEVCGKAALYFDPRSMKDIASKIEQVLADAKLREDLVKKGVGNVGRFSWEKMAEQTLKVFDSVV